MAVSQKDLASIINRASKLCSPHGDNIVSSKAGEVRGRLMEEEGLGGPIYAGGPLASDYDGDAAKWDSLISESSSEDYGNSMDIQYSNDAFKSSGMPDAIKKSLMEKKIDVGRPQTSVLDTLGIKPKPRQVMTEQRPAYSQQAVGGVDYSIIKAIVSECIKEYFSNNILAENSLKTIGIKAGTISLVDNSGNVFQAKLKKVGNANKDE